MSEIENAILEGLENLEEKHTPHQAFSALLNVAIALAKENFSGNDKTISSLILNVFLDNFDLKKIHFYIKPVGEKELHFGPSPLDD